MVQDAKIGDAVAKRKLPTFLRGLSQASGTCLLIKRSLDILTNSLNSEPQPFEEPDINGGLVNTMNTLPAFPYRDTPVNLGDDPSAANMDLDSFSLLDCFPEQHMENAAGDWYLPRPI